MPDNPSPNAATGWQVLRAWHQEGHVLGALEATHVALGDVFRLPLPGFGSVVMVGPEANRMLLTEARESFRWRAETDPVTRLLRHGLLVEDGSDHNALRAIIRPALHTRFSESYLHHMQRCTDRVLAHWHDGGRVELLAVSALRWAVTCQAVNWSIKRYKRVRPLNFFAR